MNRVVKGVFITVIFLFPLFLLAGNRIPSLPHLTPEQWKKLEKGEVVLTTEVKKVGDTDHALIGAYLIFNRPVTDVWRLMIHPEDQYKYLPDLEYSKLIWRRGNKVDVEFMVKVLFVKLYYRVIHTYYPERYYFNWTLDPNFKNDLKYLYGEWQLYPLKGGRTLARYMTELHVSSFVPGWLEKRLTKSNVPKNMKAFQMWINSNGHYHK